MALRFQGKKMKSHLDKMLSKYKRGESIGATAEARLKARGLIARETGDKKKDISFIAQEYQQVLPDQVNEHAANEEEKGIAGTDTLLGLTPNLVPYLVKAIQELSAEIATLKQQLGK